MFIIIRVFLFTIAIMCIFLSIGSIFLNTFEIAPASFLLGVQSNSVELLVITICISIIAGLYYEDRL